MGIILMKKENGPRLVLGKHEPKVEIKEAAQSLTESLILRLRPPDLRSSLRLTEHDYQRSCSLPPPPAKPPPQPPDYPPKIGLVSTISDFPANYSPIYLPINGKRDAAGDDPGALQFHRVSSASVFDATNSLEDKAGLKGLARQPITLIDDRYVEEWSLNRPPPAEPPPHSLIDRVSVHWVFSNIGDYTWQLSGRKEAASDDPGDILNLRNPVFAAGFAFDCSLEDVAYLKRSARAVESQVERETFSLRPLAEPPPIPRAGLECIVKKLKQHRLWIMVRYGHSPRPPESEANGEISLNNRKGDERLVKGTCLQVQMEIVFVELLLLSINWECCTSLDKWNLKLNLLMAQAEFKIMDQLAQQGGHSLMKTIERNTRAGRIQGTLIALDSWDLKLNVRNTQGLFKRIKGQLTHQSGCTDKNPIKLHSFSRTQSTPFQFSFPTLRTRLFEGGRYC